MSPTGLGAAVAAFCLAPLVSRAQAPEAAPAPSLARLTYVERKVEQGAAGSWRAAREGEALRVGDQLRTALDALLRVEFS